MIAWSHGANLTSRPASASKATSSLTTGRPRTRGLSGRWARRTASVPQPRRHYGRYAAWLVLTLLLLASIGTPLYVLAADPGAESASPQAPVVPTFPDSARFLTYDAASGLFGYADSAGTMVIEPRFERAGQFLHGLAPVQIETESGDVAYGYIDTSGTMVIPAQFKTAAAFCEGLARVEMTIDGVDRFGFIDRSGKMVIEPQYAAAWDFSQGLARVAVIRAPDLVGYGYVDRTGAMVIEPRFESARDFSQGLAAVAIDDVWGYIDRTGAWVIEPRFTYALSFVASGLAAVDLGAPGTTSGEEASVDERYPSLHQAYVNKDGAIVWERAEE